MKLCMIQQYIMTSYISQNFSRLQFLRTLCNIVKTVYLISHLTNVCKNQRDSKGNFIILMT